MGSSTQICYCILFLKSVCQKAACGADLNKLICSFLMEILKIAFVSSSVTDEHKENRLLADTADMTTSVGSSLLAG